MPNYTYKCVKCGSLVENQRRIDDRNKPAKCHCGNECKRTIEAPSLSGFNNLGQSR